jgi:hypothetical protein
VIFRFKQDTFKFNLDKKSHYCVSFGLYYTFYTYTTSLLLSIFLALLIGWMYETYQGFSKHHSGYSHVDVYYNNIGVISAALIHWIYIWLNI